MIVNNYKMMGDAATCNNSRCMSLLPTAGKVLAIVMLTRVIKHISEKVFLRRSVVSEKSEGPQI